MNSAILITSTLAFAAPAFADPVTEVFFEFDSARLPEGTSDALADVVAVAKAKPTEKIVIDGHACPIGSPDYNVGLSLRRAEAVRSRLQMMGVDADRIYLVGYGEDAPGRPTRAQDRRVSVSTTVAPLHAVIDRALVDGTAVVWNEPVTAAMIDGPTATQVSAR